MKMISVVLIPILILFFLNNSFSQKVLTPEAEKAREYASFLASDEMKGRFPGTEENTKAAEFILQKFQSFGLQPINGTSMQEFPFESGIKLSDKNILTFNTLLERPGLPKEMWKPVTKKWSVSDDWQPVRFSENGSCTGELAFVGYGVTSKEIKYDDYEGIDVKGKIVIILSDTTERPSKEIKYSPLYDLSRFGDMNDLKYKVMNAREHGAAGIIFVKRLSDSSNLFYPLKVERSFRNSGMVCIQANRTKIATLFPKGSGLYPIELEMLKTKKPKSFILPDVTASLTVDMQKEYSQVSNVFGMVKGTDNSKMNEYIVVGAHFDHLGFGDFNSNYRGAKPQIHNGADDNASGVAALLILADFVARNPLRRPVIFCSFNAEETGLRGSSEFVKNPPVPLENIICMINFDMVGRLKENKLSIFGAGTSSGFSALVDSLGISDTLSIIKAAEGYAPSDHANFYAEKKPVLFLFTGVHTDYHLPTDDVEKLNYEGIAKISRFAKSILNSLGNADSKPDFIQVTGDVEKPKDLPGSGYAAVWFGIVPDFEDNPDGYRIKGTSAGSPAEKAGLQGGDIITTFGDMKIKNLHDLTFCLKQHKPGDVVIVEFIRNGSLKKADVKLVAK